MEQLEVIMDRFFGDRVHVFISVSELKTAPGVATLLRAIPGAPEPSIAELPIAAMAAAAIGLVPIVIIRWDVEFERDVKGDQVHGFLEARDRVVPETTFAYDVAFASYECVKRFMLSWSTVLERQGRHLFTRDGSTQSQWSYDCRKGERYVSMFLGLQPVAGTKAQA